MKLLGSQKRTMGILILGIAIATIALVHPHPTPAASPPGLFPWEFREAARQGFGDRQNSGAWSMQWWRGKLYVGTSRAWFCWSQAWFNKISPLVPYPPSDPDFDCAPDPRNLALQAEIWRYTPETAVWERVYQSPKDVEIPGNPGWYTARDFGYRDMIVFNEPDGTEALYVVGATVNALWPPMPPPRILRSTDGVTFEPIPQEPGTVLGDLGQDQATFRDLEVFNGRLYVINGKIQGHGSVMEAENPAGGNDNFRWVTPQDMRVFETVSFNGFLYIGLSDRINGYSVIKTDAVGPLPYHFTTVITNGAFLQPNPSISVVSMYVFKNRLYVGTDEPVELIRINPDDSWDLVVGNPRETPDGWKYPLSGMGAGFDWPANQHLWRIQEHDDVLYLGTNDVSLRWGKAMPWFDEWLNWQYGFDLYRTWDGHYVSPITVNGFGDKFQIGIRTFASTPYGLFAGTVSFWYGLRIWQGIAGATYSVYLPLITEVGSGTATPLRQVSNLSFAPNLDVMGKGYAPPERLEVESQDGQVILSWAPPSGAIRFHVLRSDFTSNRQLQIPDLEPAAWVPGPFSEVGTTEQFFFIDTTGPIDKPAQYYVLAEYASGYFSQPSNLVRAPSLAPPVTFDSLDNMLAKWLPETVGASNDTRSLLDEARYNAQIANLDQALQWVEQLHQNIRRGQVTGLESWQAEDLGILLGKLSRRIWLAQVGAVAASDLN